MKEVEVRVKFITAALPMEIRSKSGNDVFTNRTLTLEIDDKEEHITGIQLKEAIKKTVVNEDVNNMKIMFRGREVTDEGTIPFDKVNDENGNPTNKYSTVGLGQITYSIRTLSVRSSPTLFGGTNKETNENKPKETNENKPTEFHSINTSGNSFKGPCRVM